MTQFFRRRNRSGRHDILEVFVKFLFNLDHSLPFANICLRCRCLPPLLSTVVGPHRIPAVVVLLLVQRRRRGPLVLRSLSHRRLLLHLSSTMFLLVLVLRPFPTALLFDLLAR